MLWARRSLATSAQRGHEPVTGAWVELDMGEMQDELQRVGAASGEPVQPAALRAHDLRRQDKIAAVKKKGA